MTWRTRLGADRCPVGMTRTERLVVGGIVAVLLGIVTVVIVGA